MHAAARTLNPACPASRSPAVTYDAQLVEETVLLAMRAEPPERQTAFRQDRDSIYEVADADMRDTGFRELHARWFVSLELGRPLERALGERPELMLARGCSVLRAQCLPEEAADLAAGADAPLIVICLRPQSLIDRERLLPFLRHELMHVADMLDPAFGYERELPVSEAGPAYDGILRDRYRVIWDTTIDGRLVRGGLLPATARQVRLAEFARAFPMLAERTEECFARWFGEARPVHREIVTFAMTPGSCPAGRRLDGRCPLCRLPVAVLDGQVERLAAETVAELVRRYPQWRPELGLCRQCADLSRSRHGLCLASRPEPSSNSPFLNFDHPRS